MRFCPGCGASVIAGARFCVECGENLAAFEAAAAGAGKTPALAGNAPRNAQAGATYSAPTPQAAASAAPASFTNAGFMAVFGAIVIVGAVVAYLIMRQLPQREQLLSTAPATSPSSPTNANQLPPDHPKVELPKEARDFIAQLEQKTKSNPNDITSWNRLGDVSLRAAMFDSSYYAKGADAYAHVLKLDPDNLNALRGIGNIDFDQRKFDEAVAAYEHYLSKKPDDPDVRTDLGTMLLSSGVADQAVNQYKKVLETHPKFFEANFNLGIAYSEMNQTAGARAAFETALKLAPDDAARNRVNQMIASLNEVESAPAAPSGPSPQVASNTPAANTFKGAFEQMLRDLPIAGPKVQSVQWSSATRARVLMDNFPMDQMPPFAATKFMTDLKAGIDQVKSAHQITAPVELDIADAASGRVMKSVTE